MVVAIAMGRSGIDALLVASQVVLSIVLPFITFPLIYLTSSKSVMRVHKTSAGGSPAPIAEAAASAAALESANGEIVDYSSGKVATLIGAAILLLVVLANMYVIVMLAMGKEG